MSPAGVRSLLDSGSRATDATVLRMWSAGTSLEVAPAAASDTSPDSAAPSFSTAAAKPAAAPPAFAMVASTGATFFKWNHSPVCDSSCWNSVSGCPPADTAAPTAD